MTMSDIVETLTPGAEDILDAHSMNSPSSLNLTRSLSPPDLDRTSSASPTSPISSGNKRPAPNNRANRKDGDQLSDKKLRRLEKNRLSARECRRRKREATENMEREINVLEGENLRLRLQLQIGDEAEHTNEQEQTRLTEGIDALLKSGASEGEILAKIEEYKEKFADYGRDRRSAIEFHLRNVERLLQPTQTTSFVLTTLQNGASSLMAPPPPPPDTQLVPAISKPQLAIPSPAPISAAPVASPPEATTATTAAAHPFTDTKSLFRYLVQCLEVTPEQGAALKDSRFVAQEMDNCLKDSVSVLKELQARLTQCGESLEAEFANVRTILTPTQAAKFLVWVANNGACMHMLNELWSKVYPQESLDDGDDD